LTGNWREEHLFVLRQALGMYDDIARHLAECDARLQAELKNLGENKINLGKPPRSGSKQRLENSSTKDSNATKNSSLRAASQHSNDGPQRWVS